LVSVRKFIKFFRAGAHVCSINRVLRAAYENKKVQEKLTALNTSYTGTFVQSAPHGNKLKVMAIMHMMTGIKPESFDDYETFASKIKQDATCGTGDPLECSPTIAFSKDISSPAGELRPIRHYPPDGPQYYFLLGYEPNVDVGMSRKSILDSTLAKSFVWAVRPKFDDSCVANKPPLPLSTGPKLDTKGYFVSV
jgi:hypothetical protein